MTTTSSETLPRSLSRDKPCYLFHKDVVRENFTRLTEAFKSRYENFVIAYSFKTNYLKDIVQIASESGCMAEVVSPYEFRYAKKTGMFDDMRIVYNGVIRDANAKFKLAANGGYVNVDNYAELEQLKAMAESSKTKIQLGVRVNFPVGNGLVSRFGMDIDDEDFAKSMALIERSSYLSFSGFHCHIGTSRPVVYWSEKVNKMIELAKKFDAKYIDLGGGMYGPMPEELAKQFNGYSTFERYAETVCNKMNDTFPNHDVQLIVEPGTAIVGNAMDALAHVTDIKRVRGATYITVDICSNHLGMICECRDIPVEIIGDDNRKGDYVTNATIAGCTCLEFDYIKKGFEGKVSIGDIIIFKNVGAYSISASRQFIVPRLAVVDASTHHLLKSAEDINDMFLEYLA